MIPVLLIRHCQSQGQAPDAPLTADGAEAAIALADRLLDLGVDAAYLSFPRRLFSLVHGLRPAMPA